MRRNLPYIGSKNRAYILYRVSQKTPTTLGKLCRTASWLFFKTEPLPGAARFGRCRASKCTFHLSTTNRTYAVLDDQGGNRRGRMTNYMLTAYVYCWSVESQCHQTKLFPPCSRSTSCSLHYKRVSNCVLPMSLQSIQYISGDELHTHDPISAVVL